MLYISHPDTTNQWRSKYAFESVVLLYAEHVSASLLISHMFLQLQYKQDVRCTWQTHTLSAVCMRKVAVPGFNHLLNISRTGSSFSAGVTTWYFSLHKLPFKIQTKVIKPWNGTVYAKLSSCAIKLLSECVILPIYLFFWLLWIGIRIISWDHKCTVSPRSVCAGLSPSLIQ